ncbi:hypothetical protein BKA70DRAFT_1384968 [Coprinopsis sp. MPI-PUGE-AT-0042]|nr:hypothetical protein BKA70DRAFT_1384968 [Coprinopsis sp. MPI-PUGE-AT-0042]
MRNDVLRSIFTIGLFASSSLYLTWTLASFARQVKELLTLEANLPVARTPRPTDSWSWIGHDHPERPVKMVAQESIHFSLTDQDAEDEWLWTGTPGDGHIRLGKDMRMFAVAMFHQLHCLRGVRNAMVKGWKNLHPARRGHIHPLLQLRDFTKRNFTLQRTGATHTCLDWEPAYEMMRSQWQAWEAYREAHNITVMDEDDG